MKYLFFALPALLLVAPAAAQTCEGVHAPGTVRLSVATTNLRSARGEVAVTVYPDDRRRFLASGGKLARVRARAAAPVTRACFWLKPGYYAVAIYHDENADHDFNRTLIAPREGYGFSNDAPANFALPSFKATRFGLGAGGGEIRVRTRYP